MCSHTAGVVISSDQLSPQVCSYVRTMSKELLTANIYKFVFGNAVESAFSKCLSAF
jgi:hypothetical protein